MREFSFKPLDYENLSALGRNEEAVLFITFRQSKNTQKEISRLTTKLREKGFTVNNNNEIYDNDKLWGVIKIKDSAHDKAIMQRAETAYLPVDKSSKALFSALDGFDSNIFYTKNGDVKLKTGELANGDFVKVAIRLDIKELLEHPEIKVFRELIPFDYSIHNAVTSVLVAGSKHFTINSIYRAITGYERYEDQPCPPQIAQAITESLDKMRYMSIRINATDEAEKFNYPALKKMKKAVFESYVLPIKSVEVELDNGQIIEAYELLDTPPLYAYARSKNQVINAPVKTLTLPENIEATSQVIVIRDYLLAQIGAMKNKNNNRNNIILFETLFNFLKVDESAKTQRVIKQRIRATVEAILTEWTKTGYISGFEFVHEGRKITKIKINSCISQK